jgi:hypothetical protein
MTTLQTANIGPVSKSNSTLNTFWSDIESNKVTYNEDYAIRIKEYIINNLKVYLCRRYTFL